MWSAEFDIINPNVNEELVERTQEILGHQLPASYIKLMTQKNGGYLDGRVIKLPEIIPQALSYYSDEGYLSIGKIAGINPIPWGLGSISYSLRMIEEWDLPQDLVLLDGDGHTWVALDYRSKKVEPSVIFIESKGNSCIILAEKFEDFVALMETYNEVFYDDGELR